MNKVKKVLTGIGITFAGLISKVYAIRDTPAPVVSLYAVNPGPETRVRILWDSISKIAIPVVLFVIGLFVVLSKKITKKVKAIVVAVLIVLAIFGYILMKIL